MSNPEFIYGKNINTGTNYGHIGDRYEGVKQRIFTEEDFKYLENQIKIFSSQHSESIDNSHLTIGNPGDKESTIYSQQIFNALTENGYKVEMSTLLSFGYIDKNFNVSTAPDNTILIEVYQAPNV